jgi:hypothetical protein
MSRSMALTLGRVCSCILIDSGAPIPAPSVLAQDHRQRLLKVFRTIPPAQRERFLTRLHSSTKALSIGAWSELEFAHLLAISDIEFDWSDERAAGADQRRSLDMVIEGRLHSEVTHAREEDILPQVQQFFRFIGKERLPPGVYALTVGEGQVPIVKLRTRLGHALADGLRPVSVTYGGWRIEQIEQDLGPIGQVGDASRLAAVGGLLSRVRSTVGKKRRQARDAGVSDLVISMVLFDRHAEDVVRLLSDDLRLTRDLLVGSAGDKGQLTVHAGAIGAVPLDRWPPEPEWTLFLNTTEYPLQKIRAPTVSLADAAPSECHIDLEDNNVSSAAETYYVRVSCVQA